MLCQQSLCQIGHSLIVTILQYIWYKEILPKTIIPIWAFVDKLKKSWIIHLSISLFILLNARTKQNVNLIMSVKYNYNRIKEGYYFVYEVGWFDSSVF